MTTARGLYFAKTIHKFAWHKYPLQIQDTQASASPDNVQNITPECLKCWQLITWSTAANFKPLILSVLGFALSGDVYLIVNKLSSYLTKNTPSLVIHKTGNVRIT
jgi:hypothetical protein